jgi:hypothetical protein
MSAPNPYIPHVLENQDLERLKFAQNLRQNPEDYNAFVSQRVDSITNEIFNRKRTAFQKAHIDLARYMDMDHNANFYKTRAADVDRLTAQMMANNQAVTDALKRDKDISKRQFEINEWYNYNKLETLFFLQLFFISALCMAVVIYFQKKGGLTGEVASLLTAVLAIIVVVTGFYRYQYTKKTRDARLWSRRDFGSVKEVVAVEDKCTPSGPKTFDLHDYLPKAATQCADQVVQSATSKFKKWQDQLESEIFAYQTGDKAPAGLNLGAQICDALSNGN